MTSANPVSNINETEEGEEEEDNTNSKEVQAGKGSYGKEDKKCKKKEVPEKAEKCEEEPIVINFEKGCTSHSFCIVENLKSKGIYPIQPKGLPWSSGRLLYLPGQRPDYFDKTPEELLAIEKRKNKKKKALQKKKKKIGNKLRHGDHVKLCDVMSTTQELMLLMRIIVMVMENKMIERRKILADMQTDKETFEIEEEILAETIIAAPVEEMEEMEEIEGEVDNPQ